MKISNFPIFYDFSVLAVTSGHESSQAAGLFGFSGPPHTLKTHSVCLHVAGTVEEPFALSQHQAGTPQRFYLQPGGVVPHHTSSGTQTSTCWAAGGRRLDGGRYLLAGVRGDGQAVGHESRRLVLLHQPHRHDRDGHLDETREQVISWGWERDRWDRPRAEGAAEKQQSRAECEEFSRNKKLIVPQMFGLRKWRERNKHQRENHITGRGQRFTERTRLRGVISQAETRSRSVGQSAESAFAWSRSHFTRRSVVP